MRGSRALVLGCVAVATTVLLSNEARANDCRSWLLDCGGGTLSPKVSNLEKGAKLEKRTLDVSVDLCAEGFLQLGVNGDAPLPGTYTAGKGTGKWDFLLDEASLSGWIVKELAPVLAVEPGDVQVVSQKGSIQEDTDAEDLKKVDFTAKFEIPYEKDGKPAVRKGSLKLKTKRVSCTEKLSGPWIFADDGGRLTYMIFDGAGTIVEVGAFGVAVDPAGSYEVKSNGTFTGTIFGDDGPDHAFKGKVLSPTLGEINSISGMHGIAAGLLIKVLDLGASEGTWSATLENRCDFTQTASAKFSLGPEGEILSFQSACDDCCLDDGTLVRGRGYCSDGEFVMFLVTTAGNECGEVRVLGWCEGSLVEGMFEPDSDCDP